MFWFNKNKFCPNRIKRVKRYAFLANIDIKFKFLAFLFCSFFNQTLTSVFKTIWISNESSVLEYYLDILEWLLWGGFAAYWFAVIKRGLTVFLLRWRNLLEFKKCNTFEWKPSSKPYNSKVQISSKFQMPTKNV